MDLAAAGSSLASPGERLTGLDQRSTVQILKRPLQQFRCVLHTMRNHELDKRMP